MEETIIFPDSNSGESASNSGDSGGRPKGKAFPIRENDKVTRLRVCVSAQDLRSFMMEEKIKGTGEECSPRAVLEDCMRSLESETSNSKASTSSAEAPATPCVSSHWQRLFRLWRPRSMRRLATFPPLGVPKPPKRHTRSVREGQGSTEHFLDDAQYFCFKPSWKNFTLAEIRAATNNFSSENIIGLGGYAKVYRGRLQNGQLVAIKRLTRGTTEEKIGDFLSELGIIVHVNHPNAAKLIGYGVEGGMFLVLKLSPHGSLASRLHGSKEKPDWSIRYKVALGTAEGIQYFHEGCPRRIIHRDIKAANILLTEDFEPEICDFGLAKWLPEQWTHHTVLKFEGTFGYLAPEYIMHGIVDEKTDVFAFGVLVLELITGRKALDSSQQSLVMWAKPLLDKNDMRQLVDPSLKDDYDAQQMNCLALAASLCTQRSPILRPRISEVVLLLRGEVSLESMKLSERMLLQRTQSEELSDGEEYNSTEYLNDLNRYKQLALEV